MAFACANSVRVSSLGNTLGDSATGETRAPASAFGNQFSSAVSMSAVSNQIGSKEDKNSMMAAFSDMGLALNVRDGSAAATVPATAPSSAKALLAKKETKRRQEEQEEAEYHARREARQVAKQQQQQSAPVSALMQAIDAFAGEVSQSETFTSTLHRKPAPGAFSVGSRRARQKQEKANARGDAGSARGRAGKSVRDLKRHQRRENYRHVY